MTYKTRAEIAEAVTAGDIPLEEGQRLARQLFPMPAPVDYHGFAGATAAEMCGDY